LDDSVAPPGQHLMIVFGQHIPYHVAGNDWTAENRSYLIERVLDTLSRYAPDIRQCVRATDLLTPADLERVFSLPGGHVHHGEISADQAFFKRPVPEASDYRTPIKDLFQCGASVHPGGGVTGVPGYNAAQVVLRTLR
jgi:phytoene dehydrogenase-like protein